MPRPLIAFCLLCVGAAHAVAQTPAPPAVQECLRLKALEIDWGDRENAARHRKLWLDRAQAVTPHAICRQGRRLRARRARGEKTRGVWGEVALR